MRYRGLSLFALSLLLSSPVMAYDLPAPPQPENLPPLLKVDDTYTKGLTARQIKALLERNSPLKHVLQALDECTVTPTTISYYASDRAQIKPEPIVFAYLGQDPPEMVRPDAAYNINQMLAHDGELFPRQDPLNTIAALPVMLAHCYTNDNYALALKAEKLALGAASRSIATLNVPQVHAICQAALVMSGTELAIPAQKIMDALISQSADTNPRIKIAIFSTRLALQIKTGKALTTEDLAIAAQLQTILATQPSEPEYMHRNKAAYVFLTAAYLESGQYKKAFDTARSAASKLLPAANDKSISLRLLRPLAHLHYSLAKRLQEAGQTDLALQTLKAGLAVFEASPFYDEIYQEQALLISQSDLEDELAQIYATIGNAAEADRWKKIAADRRDRAFNGNSERVMSQCAQAKSAPSTFISDMWQSKPTATLDLAFALLDKKPPPLPLIPLAASRQLETDPSAAKKTATDYLDRCTDVDQQINAFTNLARDIAGSGDSATAFALLSKVLAKCTPAANNQSMAILLLHLAYYAPPDQSASRWASFKSFIIRQSDIDFPSKLHSDATTAEHAVTTQLMLARLLRLQSNADIALYLLQRVKSNCATAQAISTYQQEYMLSNLDLGKVEPAQSMLTALIKDKPVLSTFRLWALVHAFDRRGLQKDVGRIYQGLDLAASCNPEDPDAPRLLELIENSMLQQVYIDAGHGDLVVKALKNASENYWTGAAYNDYELTRQILLMAGATDIATKLAFADFTNSRNIYGDAVNTARYLAALDYLSKCKQLKSGQEQLFVTNLYSIDPCDSSSQSVIAHRNAIKAMQRDPGTGECVVPYDDLLRHFDIAQCTQASPVVAATTQKAQVDLQSLVQKLPPLSPDLLQPYLDAAVAQARTGNKTQAIANIKMATKIARYNQLSESEVAHVQKVQDAIFAKFGVIDETKNTAVTVPQYVIDRMAQDYEAHKTHQESNVFDKQDLSELEARYKRSLDSDGKPKASSVEPLQDLTNYYLNFEMYPEALAKNAEIIAILQHFRKANDGHLIRKYYERATIQLASGDRKAAEQIAATIDLNKVELSERQHLAVDLAAFYLEIGQRQKALDLLDKYASNWDHLLPTIKYKAAYLYKAADAKTQYKNFQDALAEYRKHKYAMEFRCGNGIKPSCQAHYDVQDDDVFIATPDNPYHFRDISDVQQKISDTQMHLELWADDTEIPIYQNKLADLKAHLQEMLDLRQKDRARTDYSTVWIHVMQTAAKRPVKAPPQLEIAPDIRKTRQNPNLTQ